MSARAQWMVVLGLVVAAGVAAGGSAVPGGRGAAPQIRIVAKDFAFTPKTVTLRAGPAVFVITNSGTIQHGFAIDALKVRTPLIAPGRALKVTVHLQPGTYQAYCNVPGHMQIGMAATVVVRRPPQA